MKDDRSVGVTYAIASAGRLEPIPELEVVDEVFKLACCNGFFKKK